MSELGRPLPAMTLAVVGVQYPNDDGSDRRAAIEACAIGEPVELRPEPKNKFDELAVAVFSQRGEQLGYLTAERCGRIGGLIRKGHEVRAVFQGKEMFGAWIRVAFDGEEPVVRDLRKEWDQLCIEGGDDENCENDHGVSGAGAV